MMKIAVGQVWRTRNDQTVTVSKDRAKHALVPRWRWALSSGEIVDDSGNAGVQGPHDSDLITLVHDVFPPEAVASRDQVDGMDSMMHEIP